MLASHDQCYCFPYFSSFLSITSNSGVSKFQILDLLHLMTLNTIHTIFQIYVSELYLRIEFWLTYRTVYSPSLAGCLGDISELACQNLYSWPSPNPDSHPTLLLADKAKALRILSDSFLYLSPHIPTIRKFWWPCLPHMHIPTFLTTSTTPTLVTDAIIEDYTSLQTHFPVSTLASFSLFSTHH